MRRCLPVVLLVSLIACGGGGGSTPTAPTTPTTPTTPTVPTPTFPNMVGNWSGTLIVVVSAQGTNLSNTCAQTWTITTQNAGAFSGTFQLSGGTVASCAQAGNVSGTIGSDSRLSGINLGVTIGATGCTRLAGDGIFSGLLSNGTVSATSSDQVSCSGVTGNRNLTIALGK